MTHITECMQSYLYKDLYLLEDKHWWHVSKRKAVFYFLKNYASVNKPNILDIGCGTGKNLEALSTIGKATGIDKSKDAIEYCKKRGLSSVFLKEADTTGFPSNTFDVITILDVIEHTDDRKTLQEVYRLLKPKGIVICTVPAFQMLWSQWDEVLEHKRRYTVHTLSHLFMQYKLKIVKISYMYSYLFIPVLLIRAFKSRISKKNYGSDFHINSKAFNWILFRIARLEFFLIQRFNLPFGTSLLCVAEKPA